MSREVARRGVVVLGMHRSGTSAATRLVSLLGVRPPREVDLVPPSPKNPTGYWESMSLVAFNERLLAALGTDMRWPALLEQGWETDAGLEALRAEAPAAFRWAFPYEPWVWKDPRLCLTLSFWRSVLDVRPPVLLVNRNPLEIVSSSLQAGRGEGKRYFLALWERYLRCALAQLEGLPVLVTSYERLLGGPVEWCAEVGAFLQTSGVSVTPASSSDVLRFIDKRLRHAESAREAVFADPELSGAQRALFLLLEASEGAHPAFRAPELPEETRATDSLLTERRRALRRTQPTSFKQHATQALRTRLLMAYRLLAGSQPDR